MGFRCEGCGAITAEGARCPRCGPGGIADGSGLLDIRAIARSLPSMQPVLAPSMASMQPAIGRSPLPALQPGPTVVVPPRPAPTRASPIVLAVAIATTGLVIASGVVALAIHTSAQRAPVAASPIVTAPVAPPEPIAIVAPDPPVPAVAPMVVPAEDRPREAPRRPRVERPIDRRARETDAPPASPAIVSEVDRILEPAAPPVVPHPHEPLPQTPSRTEIMRAMQAVQAEVGRCGDGGRVLVSIVFEGATGRVSRADVIDPQPQSAMASCVLRAVRSATVRRFAGASMTIRFPFAL